MHREVAFELFFSVVLLFIRWAARCFISKKKENKNFKIAGLNPGFFHHGGVAVLR